MDGIFCHDKLCFEFLNVEHVGGGFISKFKIITVDHS